MAGRRFEIMALATGLLSIGAAAAAPGRPAAPVDIEPVAAKGEKGNAKLFGRGTSPGGPGGLGTTLNETVAAPLTGQGPQVRIGSTGGAGGAGDTFGFGYAAAGDGGTGGSVTVDQLAALSGASTLSTPDSVLLAYSQGGHGGSGAVRKGAGRGGDGGPVSLRISAPVMAQGNLAAVWARSIGGNSTNIGVETPALAATTTGGNGGAVLLTLSEGVGVSSDGARAPAAIAESLGGRGGDVGNQGFEYPNVANGGAGGTVTVRDAGALSASGDNATALLAQSVGGSGGDGASSGGAVGGSGGKGGAVNVFIDGPVSTTGEAARGILAQSIGGSGGRGASVLLAGQGGTGGAAGGGGAVSVTNTASVSTAGDRASALLVQSVGGGNAGDAFQIADPTTSAGGGTGGSGGPLFFGTGGQGGYGGKGGAATAINQGSIATEGDQSYGILAQSVGGGGGNGGSTRTIGALVSVALGGGGGGGGDGDTVTVSQAASDAGGAIPSIITYGDGAAGILAQSVGGSGGVGGSAKAYSGGLLASLSYAVGGSGGGGGSGGLSQANNAGLISTAGTGSAGISVLSVGGGGGTAGDASSFAIAGSIPSVPAPTFSLTYALGGSGGDGGAGGIAGATNVGSIETSGARSVGLLAASIGGGGGDAGSGTTESVMLGTVLNVGISAALGGSGGGGGGGSKATVTNTGLIETSGRFSAGMVALSVGGGGGIGGGATSTSYVGIPKGLPGEAYLTTTASLVTAAPLNLNLSLGGSGGKGGSGGEAVATNQGTISTTAANAAGIFAESIGGGGGNSASYSGDGSASANIKIGGSGGGGGNGGAVEVTNDISATISTQGAGASAIVAQSIGGGGGNAGAPSAAETTSVTSSGAFKKIKTVTTVLKLLNKSGKISTGLYKKISGNSGYSEYFNKNSAIQGNFKIYTNFISRLSSLYEAGDSDAVTFVKTSFVTGLAVIEKAFQESLRKISDRSVSVPPVAVNVSLGGSGGLGGDGGNVTVTHAGTILTSADDAFGIMAQSIGGGGGTGGGAVTEGIKALNIDVSVGGSGGKSGSGGEVAVTLTPASSLATAGYGSYGVLAQSIGGGGGVGGESTAGGKLSLTVNVSVGGKGGTSGDGGKVKVDLGGSIVTTGDEAHAVYAQSVGGGGGVDFLAPAVLTDGDGGTGDASLDAALAATYRLIQDAGGGGGSVSKTDSANFPSPSLNLSYGADGGLAGRGGDVSVVDRGRVSTTGDGAFGIFEQSIGGGGGGGTNGLAQTNNSLVPVKLTRSFGGSNGASGNGGTVAFVIAGMPQVTTQGAGSVGVYLQSIGGGGGYGGLSSTATFSLADSTARGDGGAISVSTLDAQSSVDISTSGQRAHGLFAQSLGAGGGSVTVIGDDATPAPGVTRNGAIGRGGPIDINARGTITATGDGSDAIRAESGVQTTTGALDPKRLGHAIVIDWTGTLRGGSGGGAAIAVDGGLWNKITIEAGSTVSAASGIAITGGAQNEKIYNNGTIIGDVLLGSGDNAFENQAGAVYRTSAMGTVSLNKGMLRNLGTVDIGGVGVVSTATVNGVFAQTDDGHLLVDVGAGDGGRTSDLLQVNGRALLRGTIDVNVIGGLLAGDYTVLTATTSVLNLLGGAESSQTAASVIPVSWSVERTGNSIAVAPHADFAHPKDTVLAANAASVADAIQKSWLAGTADDAEFFGRVIGIRSGRQYQSVLDDLDQESNQNVMSTTFGEARVSLRAVMSCPAFAQGVLIEEGECVWSKVTGTATSMSSSVEDTGYNSRNFIYRVGAQKAVAEGWFVGASGAYGSGVMSSLDGLARSHGQSYEGAAALKHQVGPWLFASSVSVGLQQQNNSRGIDLGDMIDEAYSRTHVLTAGGKLRGLYEFLLGRWYIRPSLDVDVTYAHSGAYRERDGEGLALAVGGASKTLFDVAPAVEFGGRFDLDRLTWARLYTSLGFTALSSDRFRSSARFADDPNDIDFEISSRLPDRVGDVTAGVQLGRSHGFELLVEYEGHVASGFGSHSGTGRVTYRW